MKPMLGSSETSGPEACNVRLGTDPLKVAAERCAPEGSFEGRDWEAYLQDMSCGQAQFYFYEPVYYCPRPPRSVRMPMKGGAPDRVYGYYGIKAEAD